MYAQAVVPSLPCLAGTESHARGSGSSGSGSPAPTGPFTLHQQPLSSKPITHHRSSSDFGDDSNGGADVPASLEAFLLKMQANSLRDHHPRDSTDATADSSAKPHPTASSSANNDDHSRNVSSGEAQARGGSGSSCESGNKQSGHTSSQHHANAAATSKGGNSHSAESDGRGDGLGASELEELERQLLEEGADDSDAEDERKGRTQKAMLRGVASNPLHWFGVLVPQAMRDAQSSFQKGAGCGLRLGETPACESACLCSKELLSRITQVGPGCLTDQSCI